MTGPLRTVSQLAKLAGVSVRTLHHYDHIGLLVPSSRSKAEYRLYDRGDLERLQQILVWRALGFTLTEIDELFTSSANNRVSALQTQRSALLKRRDDTVAMIKAVEAAIRELQEGIPVNDEELFEFDNPEHQEEAEQRWGDTAAWAQFQQRVTAFSDDDKQRLTKETETFEAKLAEAFISGVAADSDVATALAEEGRLFIDRNYYTCPHKAHVGLAKMYIADPRFTDHYDRRAEGLAQWYHDAITANAANHR